MDARTARRGKECVVSSTYFIHIFILFIHIFILFIVLCGGWMHGVRGVRRSVWLRMALSEFAWCSVVYAQHSVSLRLVVLS